MNILFLDQYSEIGGAQLCLLDLLPAIDDLGWRAHVAVPGHGPLIKRLRSQGVTVHPITCGPYRSGKKSARDFAKFVLDVPRQARAIARLVKNGRIELVYVNGPRLLPTAALAIGRRVPVLFHAHNYIGQNSATRALGWSIRRSSATVVACSSFVAGPLHSFVPAQRLHVVANGTSDQGFRERRFDATQSCRIGIIGRIVPGKGQADFLRAANLLAHAFPAARFIICGAPLPETLNYFDEVRSMAEGLPVDFLGWRDDIAAVLAELDLLLIPSEQEGLPRVLLEAFSAGVPVVAFPAGGIAEAIDDGVTGFLVPEATPNALSARVLELLKEPARLCAAAVNARSLWERSYRVEIYRERITRLLADLVSHPKAMRETELPLSRR
ncbi:MAG: glycosyltransferase family 4 protein [Bryobacteraceae bacterium]